MWPPSSEETLFARRTMQMAFQRTIERRRRSSLRSSPPGKDGSSARGMVLTYAVLRLAIGPVPACWARSMTRCQQVPGAVGSVMGDDRIQRLQPLGRLYRVGIDGLGLGSAAIRARCLCLDSISHGLWGRGIRGFDYTSVIPPDTGAACHDRFA